MADMDTWGTLHKPSDEAGALGEKHTPVLKVDGDTSAGGTCKVTVDVGEGKHPNEAAHFIQWVELRANDLYIGRAEFAAGVNKPIVTFTVVAPEGGATLTAIERCNLHGLWESEAVKVG